MAVKPPTMDPECCPGTAVSPDSFDFCDNLWKWAMAAPCWGGILPQGHHFIFRPSLLDIWLDHDIGFLHLEFYSSRALEKYLPAPFFLGRGCFPHQALICCFRPLILSCTNQRKFHSRASGAWLQFPLEQIKSGGG